MADFLQDMVGVRLGKTLEKATKDVRKSQVGQYLDSYYQDLLSSVQKRSGVISGAEVFDIFTGAGWLKKGLLAEQKAKLDNLNIELTDKVHEFMLKAESGSFAYYLGNRIGTASLAVWADLVAYASTPGALCCLIKIILAEVHEDTTKYEKYIEDRQRAIEEFIDGLHTTSVFLRALASILEARYGGLMNMLRDILSGLEAAILQGIGAAIVVLRDYCILKASKWVEEYLMRHLAGGEGKCLPAEQLVRTFVNILLSPSGLINYLNKLFGNWGNIGKKELDNLEKYSWVKNTARYCRIIADLLDSIGMLLNLGYICVPDRPEKEIPSPIEIEEEVPSRGLDPILILKAIAADASDLAAGTGGFTPRTRDDKRSPLPPDREVPLINRILGSEYTGDTYVHPEDISAVLQHAFGYSADVANQAAQTAVRSGCTRATAQLSHAERATVDEIKAKWGL